MESTNSFVNLGGSFITGVVPHSKIHGCLRRVSLGGWQGIEGFRNLLFLAAECSEERWAGRVTHNAVWFTHHLSQVDNRNLCSLCVVSEGFDIFNSIFTSSSRLFAIPCVY